jgi:GTP 3',8-cyclase
MLLDSYNRVHSYLRISLTDKCNLRCFYCMPKEDHPFTPASHLMTPSEIEIIAREFINLGVKKIRLTGGEPLLRKDAHEIIDSLSQFPVELSLTTNGSHLHHYQNEIETKKIKFINISLDTLQKERFLRITRRDSFDQIWENIQMLLQYGLEPTLNMVVMKGVNDDEILNFIELSRSIPFHIRFIEFMPFTGNGWNSSQVYPLKEILSTIEEKYSIQKIQDKPHDTAKNYQVIGFTGTFAIISTITAPFCGTCNRMRLTADGKMKNCLFSKNEMDLLGTLRSGGNLVDLMSIIKKSLSEKAYERGGQFLQDFEKMEPSSIQNRSMINIGG